MSTAIPIQPEMVEKIKALGLPERVEANPYLILHVFGDGTRISPKWNAQIYKNKRGELKLVTVDMDTLTELIETPNVCLTMADFKKVIEIDDAGWGFPLGGVMIGGLCGRKLATNVIDVSYFQNKEWYESKAYLEEAARISVDIVNQLAGNPNDTLIHICTGFVNSRSKDVLRENGYHVKVKEITGLLQDQLEYEYKKYICSIGYDQYYEPKRVENVAIEFDRVINWVEKDKINRVKLVKTAWNYFKN